MQEPGRNDSIRGCRQGIHWKLQAFQERFVEQICGCSDHRMIPAPSGHELLT